MKKHTNIKTAVIAIVIAALLCLLTGAARRDPLPQIGRFQIDCTNTSCYLVDTATGQVWHSGDRGFKSPKLEPMPAGAKAEPKDFIGQWRSDEENATLWLEDGGTARATTNDGQHEGRWRAVGSRIAVTVDDEAIIGEIAPSGRLILWEEDAADDKRIPFRRVE